MCCGPNGLLVGNPCDRPVAVGFSEPVIDVRSYGEISIVHVCPVEPDTEILAVRTRSYRYRGCPCRTVRARVVDHISAVRVEDPEPPPCVEAFALESILRRSTCCACPDRARVNLKGAPRKSEPYEHCFVRNLRFIQAVKIIKSIAPVKAYAFHCFPALIVSSSIYSATDVVTICNFCELAFVQSHAEDKRPLSIGTAFDGKLPFHCDAVDFNRLPYQAVSQRLRDECLYVVRAVVIVRPSGIRADCAEGNGISHEAEGGSAGCEGCRNLRRLLAPDSARCTCQRLNLRRRRLWRCCNSGLGGRESDGRGGLNSGSKLVNVRCFAECEPEVFVTIIVNYYPPILNFISIRS